eukprot:m.3127 g.3127  ORF g.3127 m.3127 type:complete len:58 (+) comp9061_c0_seq2:88-261(+)
MAAADCTEVCMPADAPTGAPAEPTAEEACNDFDIMQWFDETVGKSAGMILVFYRGFW